MESTTKGKFFSSAVQAFAVQILGVLFFYITSISLSKNDFGVFSWSNAIALTIVTLLSCGLEQVVVRRVAASKSSDWAASAYFFHALVSAIVAMAVLGVISYTAESDAKEKTTLLLVFVAQALLFIAIPLKQFLNAKERFGPYAVTALVSNAGKVVAALYLWWQSLVTLQTVIAVLIFFSALELVALLVYTIFFTELKFGLRLIAYKKLLKEALPQYISIIFDASLGRLDWIMLGLLSTNVVTADYSFAYRAFEVAKLPVFIIAPIILARLARAMNKRTGKEQTHAQIGALLKAESFLSMLLPLTLCFLWSPVVDFVTGGKYGTANETIFILLSLCIPLQFLINLFWSMCFTSKKYKLVSYATIGTAIVNLALNVILIPKYNGVGAAVAFLVATVLQFAGYYFIVYKTIAYYSLRPLFIFSAIAGVSFLIAYNVTEHTVLRLAIVVFSYLAISLGLKQIGRQQLLAIKAFTKK